MNAEKYVTEMNNFFIGKLIDANLTHFAACYKSQMQQQSGLASHSNSGKSYESMFKGHYSCTMEGDEKDQQGPKEDFPVGDSAETEQFTVHDAIKTQITQQIKCKYQLLRLINRLNNLKFAEQLKLVPQRITGILQETSHPSPLLDHVIKFLIINPTIHKMQVLYLKKHRDIKTFLEDLEKVPGNVSIICEGFNCSNDTTKILLDKIKRKLVTPMMQKLQRKDFKNIVAQIALKRELEQLPKVIREQK